MIFALCTPVSSEHLRIVSSSLLSLGNFSAEIIYLLSHYLSSPSVVSFLFFNLI